MSAACGLEELWDSLPFSERQRIRRLFDDMKNAVVLLPVAPPSTVAIPECAHCHTAPLNDWLCQHGVCGSCHQQANCIGCGQREQVSEERS